MMEGQEPASLDLGGKPIPFALINYPPFVHVTRGGGGINSRVQGRGMSWELMLTLAHYFNFTPVPLMAEEDLIGLKGEQGKWRGVLDLIDRKAAELTLLPVTLTTARQEVLDFTVLLGTTSYGVLVKRPHDSPKPDALLKPFSYEVWWMILVATLVFGPLIYLVIVVRVRLCKRESYVSRVLPLHRCMWFVYGAMMRQGSELKPTYDSSRILFATWWLFITLVTSFYTANLTAFLTFNGLQLPITTVEDLRKIHSLTWLAFTDGALVEVISTHPRLQILRDLQKAGRGRFVTSRAEAVALVRTNKYVFIDDMQVLEYLLREDFKTQRRDNASDMCNFYITPLASANDKDFLFWFGYGFRKDSEYKELFNEFFRRLSFFGILNFLHDNATSSSPVCTLPKGFKDRSLQNKDFFTTYALTAIGIIAAAIALASELICRRLSRWKQRQTYGSNSQGSSTAITGRIVSILGIGSPETVKTLNWNPANLPPLPEAKARAPFHVRYPHYTDSSNNNNNNNAAISIQMKRPQSPLEGSSPQYPHQQQQHPQQHSRGMENVFIQAQRSSYMIQGKINNTRVIWDQRRGKLIAEDATKINESVTYVDGVPQLFFKYTDQEGPKMQTLMLRDFV